MPAVHWLGGGSGTTQIRSIPAFRSYQGDQAQQGPLLYAYATDAWGGRVPGEACGAAARLLAFLSSHPTVTEHPPCSRIGMVTRLRCAQWLIQRE